MLGLSGLHNLGNTCYANSVIQALSNTDLLNHYLRNKLFKERVKHRSMIVTKSSDIEVVREHFKSTITYELYRLIVVMWNINCSIRPDKFKLAIGKKSDRFAGFNQNDSQEFLDLILDCLHEDSKADLSEQMSDLVLNNDIKYISKQLSFFDNLLKSLTKTDPKYLQIIELYINYQKEHFDKIVKLRLFDFYKNHLLKSHSAISDIFLGIYHNQITCTNCGYCSTSFEQFYSLQLAIDDSNRVFSTLLEVLDYNFTPNQIEYTCDVCKNTGQSEKKVSLYKIPSKLIIQLKRFKHHHHRIRKLDNYIDYPIENLNLSKYLSEYATNKDILLDLYSVINHMGGTGGGHYTNYSKNFIGEKWIEYNDSSVRELNTTSQIVSSSGYILFYTTK
jgi:ubiquitin carboxyl-terminal hydrolase 2/21